MARLGCVCAAACLLTLVALDAASEDCRDRTTGDICAAGSPWYEFTRFRITTREEKATTTWTNYGANDFSLDLELQRPPPSTGKILVIAGRAMLMKDVPHEKGYEIDALDGSVLTHLLLITVLDQAYPKGAASVDGQLSFSVEQKDRAMIFATPSASGRIEAPWTAGGTVTRDGNKVLFDVRLTYAQEGVKTSLGFAGFWEKAPDVPKMDDLTPLEGWSVYWLGPMTLPSEEGTTLDFGAKPAAERWKNIAALRTFIAEEPARRALRRVPVDRQHPGRLERLTFEAFEIGKGGQRTQLGQKALEYHPGTDVLAEKIDQIRTSKDLALGYGLTVGTTVYREPELTGFGLTLEKANSNGFSWEWFEREDKAVFRKLQGGGRVRVSELTGAGYKELTAIAFLDDIVLSCEDRQSGIVHEVIVKKGSVLRLAP